MEPMDSLLSPPLTPAIHSGYLGAEGGANIQGQGYAKPPQMSSSRSPAGTPMVVAKMATGGYVVIGTGGVYAPRTQKILHWDL